MTSEYVVLKSLPFPAGDTFGWSMPGPKIAGAGAPKLPVSNVAVEVASMPRADMLEMAARPDTVALAPVVPMKLIAPVKISDDNVSAAATQAWGLHAVGADDTAFTGAGVVVAVVDTGIDASHPAFAGVTLIQKDFTGEGNGDNNGHGTHCAGTIFGRPVNGVPIGVAPGVTKAVIAKVLDANGSGSSESIVKGILWAVDQGAHVISMSVGMDFPGLVQAMQESGWPVDLATSRALEAYRANTRLFDSLAAMVASGGLADQRAVIIAAAGNESRREIDPEYEISVAPPAVAVGIVSVGALGLVGGKYKVANFSNTGPNISGPGVDVLSAKAGGGLTSMSGTSMATPHVAGVAALWAEKLMKNGTLNEFQLISRLAGNAADGKMAPGSEVVDYGAGMVRCPSA